LTGRVDRVERYGENSKWAASSGGRIYRIKCRTYVKEFLQTLKLIKL